MLSEPRKIVNIIFEHTYHGPANMFPTFVVAPPLSGLGASIFRRAVGPDTMMVFTKKQTPAADTVKLKEFYPQKLLFPIHFNDPYFFNYTNIDLRPFDQNTGENFLLYFNSTQIQGTVFNANKVPVLPIRPLRFNYPISEADAMALKTIILEPIGGQSVELSKQGIKTAISLSLPEEGGYQLKLSYTNQPDQTFAFFASDMLYQRPVPAILEWYGDQEATTVPSISLCFFAREVYWRYFLIGIPETDWPRTSIQPIQFGQTTYTFKQEDDFTLPNGAKACVFHSEDRIPLRANPSWKVLLDTPALYESMRLPFPQVSLLKQIEPPLVPEKDYSAEVYVNL